MAFAVRQRESATGILVSHHHPETPSHIPPHPIPLGCLRAPALGALLNASNLHWSSVLHMVMYMFQWHSVKSSHPLLLPLNPKVSCFRASAPCAQASVVVLHWLSSCGSQALQGSLSSCGSRALQGSLSSCGSRALQGSISSCGSQA